MVSSGTTALHLGVRALGWGAGDEVLTSPFSFVASANCLLYEGARPVFCDVDPVTLNLDRDAAAAAVGERTRGILPIHIFGFPAAMPELEALAGTHDLGILEDACEAIGASDYEGRGVGTRGNLATFAFYANKQMTTGEGGMIVPSGPEIAARLRSERNQGRAADMGWLDHERPRLQLPALRPRRRARRRPGREARLAAGAPRRGRLALRAAAGRARGRRGPDRRPRPGAPQLVRLRRPPRRRGRPRRDDRPPGRARHRQQGLPALHPPLPAAARARLPRGPVPGRRSRRRPLAGAALLPGDERGPGGPCLPGAGGGARPAAGNGIIARSCPLPQGARPALLGAQPLAAVRLAAGRLRHRPVAGPRPRPARDRRPRRRRAGADRRRPRARARPHGRARLRLRGGRRGHPHGDRAAARRGDRAAGRQAPHRPLAQRPGRHRRGDGRPGPLAAGDRALRRGDGAAAGAGRGPQGLADARLHPSAARPAGLPRPPPARLLLDARPRRPPLPVRARQRQRDAARLRRPGRGQLGDRPRGGRRRPRLRPRQPQLDRRRLQPRLRPRLPGRRLDLLDAPLAARLGNRHLGRAPSSASASSTSPSPRAPRSCRRR